jgi:hypothetical protein
MTELAIEGSSMRWVGEDCFGKYCITIRYIIENIKARTSESFECADSILGNLQEKAC